MVLDGTVLGTRVSICDIFKANQEVSRRILDKMRTESATYTSQLIFKQNSFYHFTTVFALELFELMLRTSAEAGCSRWL